MVDHIIDMLKTEDPPLSEEYQDLISITRDMLEPIWLQTNLHLRLLESEGAPQAKAVLKKWRSLGTALNIRALTNPLVGCSWFMCPLYEEPSAKKMMLCKICHEAQYCSPRCQRGYVLFAFTSFRNWSYIAERVETGRRVTRNDVSSWRRNGCPQHGQHATRSSISQCRVYFIMRYWDRLTKNGAPLLT